MFPGMTQCLPNQLMHDHENCEGLCVIIHVECIDSVEIHIQQILCIIMWQCTPHYYTILCLMPDSFTQQRVK